MQHIPPPTQNSHASSFTTSQASSSTSVSQKQSAESQRPTTNMAKILDAAATTKVVKKQSSITITVLLSRFFQMISPGNIYTVLTGIVTGWFAKSAPPPTSPKKFEDVFKMLGAPFQQAASPALQKLYKDLFNQGRISEKTLVGVAGSDRYGQRARDLSDLLADPKTTLLVQLHQEFLLVDCAKYVIHQLNDEAPKALIENGQLTPTHLKRINAVNDKYMQPDALELHPLDATRLSDILSMGNLHSMDRYLDQQRIA